jgi:Rad3-related DNA helicase
MSYNPELVRRAVLAIIATVPELSDDEILRADMLEAETDYLECMAKLEDKRADAEEMTDGIALRAKRLEERWRRYQARERACRDIMLQIMQAANLRKVTLPSATISVTKARDKVQISDPAAVPPELCHPPKPPLPDMKAIREALAAGESFNWASLTEGEQSLTVRDR